MKKTFLENVFICEEFSLNRKENELRRKYRVLGGSTEKNKGPPMYNLFLALLLLRITKNIQKLKAGSHWE